MKSSSTKFKLITKLKSDFMAAPVNSPSPASSNSALPDLYYRKLCTHAGISQCNTPLPEALTSLDDTGRWFNTGPEQVAVRTLFLDFQSLHHMNVIHIQDQLVKECNQIIGSKKTNANQLDRIKVLLKDHCKTAADPKNEIWLN
jgi:hypothetical protein